MCLSLKVCVDKPDVKNAMMVSETLLYALTDIKVFVEAQTEVNLEHCHALPADQ